VQVLRKALSALGFAGSTGSETPLDKPDYQFMMREALRRIRMAELQIQEATSLEELDLGRSALLSGWAEVQQLVRAAKRERGISVRPIAEIEQRHRDMRDFLNHRTPESGSPVRRRTGTGR